MKKKTKRKTPNDATFRNINALKRRVSKLEEEMLTLFTLLKFSWKDFGSRIHLEGKKRQITSFGDILDNDR